MGKCAISQCRIQRRESRKRGREKGDDFHGDVMASAHFLLFHLREHGLRTLSRLKPKDSDEKDDDDDDEMQCEDVEFADTMARIAESTKKNGAEKLGKCSKFTISIAKDEKDEKAKGGRILKMDALFAFLRAHGDPQSEKVRAQLESEEFDSQSVESDLSLETGNICDLRADIRRFLRDFEIGARSFATGINFQYHEWYENVKGTEDQEGFGVIPRSDLFVRARFDSLKNEILSAKFLSVSDFE